MSASIRRRRVALVLFLALTFVGFVLLWITLDLISRRSVGAASELAVQQQPTSQWATAAPLTEVPASGDPLVPKREHLEAEKAESAAAEAARRQAKARREAAIQVQLAPSPQTPLESQEVRPAPRVPLIEARPADPPRPSPPSQPEPRRVRRGDSIPPGDPCLSPPAVESRPAPPRLPKRLRNSCLEGNVRVRVIVDEDGRVEPGSVEIAGGSGADCTLFTDNAKKLAAATLFEPATCEGVEVRTYTELEYSFHF